MFKCQQFTHAIFSNNHVMFICGDWQDDSIIKTADFYVINKQDTIIENGVGGQT